MSKISTNLISVLGRINQAALKQSKDNSFRPRLVAVSKYKSEENIIEAYLAGQRHFGENYVNELAEKSKSASLLRECPDIKWHFIGNLQGSKCNQIASLPNLYLVETVDSIRIADKLNKSVAKTKSIKQLKIMIQVNTSGEEQKNGCKPTDVTEIYKHVQNECRLLKPVGLMTIGSAEISLEKERSSDFQSLIQCRDTIVGDLGINKNDIELSMGMSGDFEKAVAMGSTSVRIGSLIFGERNK